MDILVRRDRQDETQGYVGVAMGAQATENVGCNILSIPQKIQLDDSHKNFSGESLSQTKILTFFLASFNLRESIGGVP